MNVNEDFRHGEVQDWYNFVGAVEKLGSGRWESQMETLSTSIANVVFQEEFGVQSHDGQQEVSALFKHLWGSEVLSCHIWIEHH